MKRAIYISILCTVMLTACGNVSESTKRAETSEVSQTTTTLTTSAATAKEEMDTSETTTTIKMSSQTVSSSSKLTDTEVTAFKKSGTLNTGDNSVQEHNNAVQGNNQAVQNNTPSNNSQDNNLAEQNAQPSNEKPQNVTQSTTAKPSASALPAITNPPVTTTKPQTTTVPQTQPPLPVPTEEERYMDIGRSLSHNGSDYSKAEAVYNWMTENGSGTCVNYSWQTYYLCKGTGLECYLAWTPSKLYGHVANVVKVNGTWFVIDTQGQGFLLNNDCGFSEIIDIDESYVSGAYLISNQRYDEIY